MEPKRHYFNVYAIFLSLVGAIFTGNIAVALTNEANSYYSTYENRGIPSNGIYPSYVWGDLGKSEILTLFATASGIIAAIYLLTIFVHKFKVLFLAIPFGMAGLMTYAYFIYDLHEDIRFSNGAVVQIILLYLVAILTLISILVRKVKLGLVTFFVTAIYCASLILLGHFISGSGVTSTFLLHPMGNSVLLLIYMISDWSYEHKLKKYEEMKNAPVPVAIANPADPTLAVDGSAPPQVAVSASILGSLGFVGSESFVVDYNLSPSKTFNVYSEDGALIGYVRDNLAKGKSVGKGASIFFLSLLVGGRKARSSVNNIASSTRPLDFDICDMNGSVLAKVTKKRGVGSSDVLAADGSKLATFKMGNLYSPAGELICKVISGFKVNYKVLDSSANEIGISNKHYQGTKSIFTKAKQYKVNIDSSVTGNTRLLAFAGILIFETRDR